MVRKLVLAVAAASALMSSNMVQALGVGEINLRSALNQPLDAEIELLQVRDLTSSEIRSVLASPDDFGKAGIDRSFFLTDLNFTPDIREDGKAVIRVTSTRPVKEPYLNFLMEVRWPSGRVLREFTLLLDPPLYQSGSAAASTSAVRPSSSGSINRSVLPQGASESTSTAVRSPASAPGEWKTSRADTLWGIALQHRPEGANVYQTMLAIQDLNPTAFIGGNINRLRADQTLTLPNAEQAAVRSRADALAQVASQTATWQNRQPSTEPAPRQLDAREREVAGDAPAQTRNGDSLRLLSGTDETSENNTDAATGGENRGLRDALDRTKEQLDSAEREKDELSDRLADMQGQLETLQRLLELKDAQLAALQQELSGNDELPDILPVPEEYAQVDTALVDTTGLTVDEAIETDIQLEQGAAADADAESGDGSEDAGEVGTEDEQIAAAPLATPTEPPPAAPDSAVPPVQPAPVTPTDEQARLNADSPEALLQRFMQSQSVLLGAGAVALLLLLLILMAIARRNARRETEQAGSFIAQSATGGDRAAIASEDNDFNVVLADAQAETQQDMGIAEDPVIEADALIAYGKQDQAADVLQSAIYEEPERTDLRLKMMEVEALRENPKGYAAQAEALRRMGLADASVDLLNARYPLMAAGLVTGAALAADSTQAEEEVLPMEADVEDEAAVPDADADAEEFDFSDFGLEEDAAASLADSTEEQEGGFDLDFDLDEELSTPEPADTNQDMSGIASEPVEPVAATSDESAELNLDDELQADNLLAELEAMSLAGSGAEAAAQDEAEAPQGDDNFTLTDADLAGFEAELQSVMHAEEGSDDSVSAEGLGMQSTIAANEQAMSADNLDDDFDFLSDTDECATKLDLARAYIDMGDEEGARDILTEVVEEGNEQQQQDAREMMGQLG